MLFDPLALPTELAELATRRETVSVLTAPWHERDAQALVDRLGVPVFAPPPDTQQVALPVEHVLATHGGPSDRAALERVLA